MDVELSSSLLELPDDVLEVIGYIGRNVHFFSTCKRLHALPYPSSDGRLCMTMLMTSKSPDDCLSRAVTNGASIETIRLLLDWSPFTRCRTSIVVHDAFVTVASEGRADVVSLLIARANINVGYQCDAALRYAASNGHYHTVALLLEHGAYVHALFDEALESAVSNGHYRTANLLLKHSGLPVKKYCAI